MQAKAIDKIREMEDRMVMEADQEENFGDAAKNQLGPSGAGKLAMWDWLMEGSSGEAELSSTQLEDARLVSGSNSFKVDWCSVSWLGYCYFEARCLQSA